MVGKRPTAVNSSEPALELELGYDLAEAFVTDTQMLAKLLACERSVGVGQCQLNALVDRDFLYARGVGVNKLEADGAVIGS